MHLPAQSASRHRKVGVAAALSVLAGIYWGASATAEIDPLRFQPRAPEHRYLVSALPPPAYDYAAGYATPGYAISLAYRSRPEPIRQWAPEEQPSYGQGYADPIQDVADDSNLGVIDAPDDEGKNECFDCASAPAPAPATDDPAYDEACAADDCGNPPPAERYGEQALPEGDRSI